LKFRTVARFCALAGLVTALIVAPPASSNPGDRLPVCAPGRASTEAPTGPAGDDSPGACRTGGHVLESAVQPGKLRESAALTDTPSGYHHLGAGTSGEWSGISGRIEVVDGSVRQSTYDFVAGRFMVKRDMGGGSIAWLEAGWAETGWAGSGRQHIYTFNTNTKTWQFYDQYVLRPGDQVWLDLHTDADGVWQAWLWWDNTWNLLTAQKLPIGSSAYVEQYVEVHVDSGRAGRIDVPPVTVDNVQLRPAGGGPAQYWRADVGTLTGDMTAQRLGGFCLDWVNRYDTWTAGDCPPVLLGAAVPPGPPPSGEAEVVGGDIEPTEQPTEQPTAQPTEQPTEQRTIRPTGAPTEQPTAEPRPGESRWSPFDLLGDW
jgi:hypothetical protein